MAREKTGDVFTALSDPSRRQVFELLVQAPRSRQSLMQATGLSRAAVTRHLAALTGMGFARAIDPLDADMHAHAPEALAALRAYVDGLSVQPRADAGVSEDRVDANARAWARLWPDYPADAYAIGQRLLRLASHVQRALKQAASSVDLVAVDLLLLDSLMLSGPPWTMTPTQLQSVLLLTKGGVTKSISRLEARGLVQRRPDPEDGRGVRVTMTPSARKLLRGLVADFSFGTDFVASMQMPADRRAQLAALLREMLALANAEGRRRGEVTTLSVE